MASHLLSACHCPARSEVCSLVAVVEAPDLFLSSHSHLWQKECCIRALPLGEKPLNLPPLEPFVCECPLPCSLLVLCRLTKVTAVDIALSHLACGDA